MSIRIAQYRLDIYNHSGERVAILESASFASFSYDIKVNDIGKLALSVSIDHAVVSVILRDFVVHILRQNPRTKIWQDEATYLIKFFEPFQDEDGVSYLMVGGVSPEWLLSARIVDPDDDPLAANGYSTKGGVAETILHGYVNEQLGPGATTARQVGLVMGVDNGRGSASGYRIRHDRLLELLQRIARQSRVDFRIRWIEGPPEGVLTFETYVGDDKTKTSGKFLYFSVERGNMIEPRLTRDYRDEQNFCYALGPGEGENREVYKVASSAATATPYSRFEFVFDANDAEDAADIPGLAQVEIIKHLGEESLSFEIGPTSVYGDHWTVGDYVTAGYAGFDEDVRISSVRISLSAEGEAIQPTVEVWN